MKFLKDKREGNIFMIPLFLPDSHENNLLKYTKYDFLKNNTYSFGRLIEINDSSGDLVEIFNYIGAIPESKECIIKSGLLFKPVHVCLGFRKKRWRFIFEDKNYNKEYDSDYNNISFLLFNEIWIGGRKEKINNRQENIEKWVVYPPTQLEDKIRKELKNNGFEYNYEEELHG
ncbi:hypothetical protein FACS189429_4630 [Bacteroidia bacterium]|nr:hypothetical protein FACS189429_4630 [Bacteroidia bacterium]GHV44544.1 hypothetical protein FACS1894180_6010 [Bacteroidia bacterium]